MLTSRGIRPVISRRRSLADLAAAMQQAQPHDADAAGSGAATALARDRWPPALNDALVAFSIDASVLQQPGAQLRFTHQLLQEALAARVLVAASGQTAYSATHFWPQVTWWQRTGWEVVAEIAAESCADTGTALNTFIAWLACAQPEVASQAWRRVGSPGLPAVVTQAITAQWLPRLTDAVAEPVPAARAAIGRALAAFDLDGRPGVGLRADGLPDIDWVPIAGGPFVYQDREKRKLAAFDIARYPVTNRQFDAFIRAGGYADDRWWIDLGERITSPRPPGKTPTHRARR